VRLFVLVLAAIWFQPLLHFRAEDRDPASFLIRPARLLDLSEFLMAASLIALACVAFESAAAHSVNQTLITMASSITAGMAR
jgi:hypothetical protein